MNVTRTCRVPGRQASADTRSDEHKKSVHRTRWPPPRIAVTDPALPFHAASATVPSADVDDAAAVIDGGVNDGTGSGAPTAPPGPGGEAYHPLCPRPRPGGAPRRHHQPANRVGATP